MKNFLAILSICFLLSAKERLAIFDLKPLNISEDLAPIISDKIIYEFQQIDRFDLVERQNLHKITEEQSLQLSGLTDSIIQLGKLLEVQKIVIGSFGRLDQSTFFISLKLLDIETGKVSTNYFTVDASFKNFVLSAPKTCIRRLLKIEKSVDSQITLSESEAPKSHVSVINYIQKDTPKRKIFTPCYNCAGKGKIIKKMGTITSVLACPICNNNTYCGPETSYRTVAGLFE